jgi:CRISPR type III-A/MTUBE-associated protein Csm6
MEEYVLFSPLGLTDPTRGNYDGAFLHIMRHYQPQKAYLYMTKKIVLFDSLDNRYDVMGKKLANFLGFACKFVKIKREDVDNPQNFEYFYKPFEEIIKNIIEENPGKTVVINVSSGTPAMKLAGCMLCAIATSPLIPVQVVTFRGEERNPGETVGEKYDIEKEWDNLIDNDAELEPQNRCSVIQLENLGAVFSREIILSLIQSYEYDAAIEVAEKISFFIDQRVVELLYAGKNRLILKLIEAKKRSDKADYELFPIKIEPAKKIFEYILYLSIKVEKGELADFTRGISPVITELFKESLSDKLERKRGIQEYCDYIRKNGLYILRKKYMPVEVQAVYDEYFSRRCQSGYRDTALSASIILPWIEYTFGKDSEITKLAQDLRKFEAKVRNPAAHILTEVTDEWIKEETGMISSQILKEVKKMYSLIYKEQNKNIQWDSYRKLNQEIQRLVQV